MRRALLLVTLQLSGVAFCFLPALGQQATSTAAPNTAGYGRLGVAGGEANVPIEAVPATGTPAWTFFAPQFVAHTGLLGHSALYDPATNVMIVFGGFDAGLAYGSTSAVLLLSSANSPGSWSLLIDNGAAGSPTSRAGHAALYDSTNNRMIVFGGCTSTGVFFGGCTNLNDVWVLSNANGQGGSPVWTQLSPTGTPPAPRNFQTGVYDAANNRMIIFGGGNLFNNGPAQTFHDVWVLTNANGLGGTPAWTKLFPTGGPPNGVTGASAVYDPVNNIMTVFGGVNSGFTAVTNAVWTLSHANGLGGTPQWTNLVANGAAGSPARRAGHTAAYDAVNNRMIIFGGGNIFSSGFPGFNDVWLLANANGLGGTPTWTTLNPPGTKPEIRFYHSAVYDALDNVLIVFAGENIDAQFFIIWVLSHANGL